MDSLFNIVSFGSNHTSLFKTSSPYTQNTLQQAISHTQSMSANMGGTELLQPLQKIYSVPPNSTHRRQVFVFTDGQVSNTDQVIKLVGSNSKKSRMFTVGIGEGVSHALVEGMARAGNGTCEFVRSGEKMEGKVMKQLMNATQPALEQIEIKWNESTTINNNTPQMNMNNNFFAPVNNDNPPKQPGNLMGHGFQGNSNDLLSSFGNFAQNSFTQNNFFQTSTIPAFQVKEICQSPTVVPPVFSGNRVLVYALFAPNVQLPSTVTFTATSPEGPLKVEIPISDQKKTRNSNSNSCSKSIN